MIFWFTGLAVAAVGKTAGEVVREVRRQFKENPGIMEYKQKPDYRACVSLVTEVSAAQNHVRTETAPPPLGLFIHLGYFFFVVGSVSCLLFLDINRARPIWFWRECEWSGRAPDES